MENHNKKKSEILADEISKLQYGEIIYHGTISGIIGENYRTQQYQQTIQAAKKILLNEYGILLESIRKCGYRVVEPDNYVTQSLKHYKRGFNEFKKGSTTLSHAPVNEMTPEGREEYRRVNDRAIILQASLSGSIVELKTLAKKRQPFIPKLERSSLAE